MNPKPRSIRTQVIQSEANPESIRKAREHAKRGATGPKIRKPTQEAIRRSVRIANPGETDKHSESIPNLKPLADHGNEPKSRRRIGKAQILLTIGFISLPNLGCGRPVVIDNGSAPIIGDSRFPSSQANTCTLARLPERPPEPDLSCQAGLSDRPDFGGRPDFDMAPPIQIVALLITQQRKRRRLIALIAISGIPATDAAAIRADKVREQTLVAGASKGPTIREQTIGTTVIGGPSITIGTTVIGDPSITIFRRQPAGLENPGGDGKRGRSFEI